MADTVREYSTEQVEAFLLGVWLFAYWKDGQRLVGTTGTTYREVEADPDRFMRLARVPKDTRRYCSDGRPQGTI